MSTETNKAICRRMLDQLYNQHRPELIPEFFAEALIVHEGRATHLTVDLEAYKQRVISALTAFPDIQITVDDEIAEGDRVVYRWTVTGTHQGKFGDIPPTGFTNCHSPQRDENRITSRHGTVQVVL
ncbi:MAG: ester cyclase [Chloroflexota bacterium]|jgi:predicted ester cyclase